MNYQVHSQLSGDFPKVTFYLPWPFPCLATSKAALLPDDSQQRQASHSPVSSIKYFPSTDSPALMSHACCRRSASPGPTTAHCFCANNTPSLRTAAPTPLESCSWTYSLLTPIHSHSLIDLQGSQHAEHPHLLF